MEFQSACIVSVFSDGICVGSLHVSNIVFFFKKHVVFVSRSEFWRSSLSGLMWLSPLNFRWSSSRQCDDDRSKGEERHTAQVVTSDGRKEWYCCFCSETKVWTRFFASKVADKQSVGE